jgi:hypothetical protein
MGVCVCVCVCVYVLITSPSERSEFIFPAFPYTAPL